MVRRIIAALAALCLALTLSAQNYKVSLTLKDASTSEAIGFATVSLTPTGDGAPRYALSDSEGKAVIEKVKKGKYRFTAEIMGYTSVTRNVTVEGDMFLGVIKMEVDSKVLDAASVSATGNPVVIKKDTVEYNASSFKISDDNVLEDLLKKLPGIEVSEDGTITANGETISKITIGGKTFFLDDPQLASKNIPAKLVEKVKVVKKKSEQAEFTGIDDGEEETVIDLSVKKGMMNGAFGSAQGGGGHDLPSSGIGGAPRWQAAGMGGSFGEKSQLSVILNANNTNNRGFNDLSGNMMNSLMGGSGGMGRGTGGFGRGGNGITTSWMAGINGNWDLFDDKMDLGGNYLYSGTNKVVEESSYKETYLENAPTIVYRTGNYRLKDLNGNAFTDYPMPDNSTTFTNGHRFGLQLDHKFSENTSILFRPQFNFGNGYYSQSSRFETDNLAQDGTLTAVNRGFSNTGGTNTNWQASGFALLRQRLGIPGRTLSVNARYNFSNNSLNGFNNSYTDVLSETTPTYVNQSIRQNTKSSSISSRIVYTEPLGDDFYLEGSYNVSYSYNDTKKNTYDINSTLIDFSSYSFNNDNAGETPNDTYTNSIVNKSFTQNIGAAFMYQHEKIRAQIGASAIPTRTHNETKGYDPYDDFRWNFAPRAMLFYDFNDNSNVRLFYWGRSVQPSTSRLLPVMDNSNPLAMSLGNPNLNPYFSHSLRSDLELSNKQSFFTMRLHLEGGYVDNPITSALWYNSSNVTYSLPVNGPDSFDTSMRLVINAPIAKSNFSIFNMTRLSFSQSSSFVGGVADMDSYFYSGDPAHEDGTFNYEKFFDYYGESLDKTSFFTVNTTSALVAVERIRATYRSDNTEIMIGARTRFNKPWYTIQAQVNPTWANQISASFKWTESVSGLEISTDADYNWYRGYTTDQPSEVVWNASVSLPIFKRVATISLKAYDILDQAKNLTVSDTANYHSEVLNNTLGRYVMASIMVRFGNFGKAGKEMRARMGGGPGGPGGMPRR